MSDTKTELVQNIFEAATPDVRANFNVDVGTLMDIGRIPLQLEFEAQIKEAAAAIKAKKAEVEAKSAAHAAARVSTDDPEFAERKKAAKAAVDALRRNLLTVAKGSKVKVGKAAVEVQNLRVDDEKGVRAATLTATVAHAGESFEDEDDVDALKAEPRVAGLGATINIVVVVPVTAEVTRLRDEFAAAKAELVELDAAFGELVREKEATIRRVEDYAKLCYAQEAAASVPGVKGLMEKTYGEGFAANVLKGLKRFDVSKLAGGKMLPAPATAVPSDAKSS